MRTIDKASRLMRFTRHRLRAELTCFTLSQVVTWRIYSAWARTACAHPAGLFNLKLPPVIPIIVPTKKILCILMSLPILFSCSTSPCGGSPPDLSPYGCDKCGDRDLFKACIKKSFSAGHSYTDLSKYLIKIGFVKSKDPADFKAKRFYFRWFADHLSNDIVVVNGRFDLYGDQLRITEIGVPYDSSLHPKNKQKAE